MKRTLTAALLAFSLCTAAYGQGRSDPSSLGWHLGGAAVTNDQQFVLMDNSPDCSAERKLTGSSTITVTDGGANSTVTLSVNGPLIQSAGGTGNSTYAKGDILAGNASNGLTKLTAGTGGHILSLNPATATGLEWIAPTAGGTVTSVGLSLPAMFTVSGSPVIAAGTLGATLADQSANVVFAGPAAGVAAAPTWRALVTADMPAGTGTVTSVGLSLPAMFTVTNSPVTTANTLTATLADQNANVVFAGPATGAAAAPTWRALVTADMPAGTGTVTSFSAGDCSPLFTTTEATATTTPALSFSLSNAAAYTVYGNATSGSAAPSFHTLTTAELPQSQLEPFNGAASWRAAPTSGTLTGVYYNNGNYTTTNTITANNVTLYVRGNVTIDHAITVTADASGGSAAIVTASTGARGSGPGGGNGGSITATNVGGGGGGGNGGAGGNGGYVNGGPGLGGNVVTSHASHGGSGGGGSCKWTTAGGFGGTGGGSLTIIATGNIVVNADITADGSVGGAGTGNSDSGGGGGSGGTIKMLCGGTWTLNAGDTISVVGGAGGAGYAGGNSAGGGGGGGGHVFVRSTGAATTSGTISVTGGAAGADNGTNVDASAGSAGSSDVVGSADSYPTLGL